MRPPYYGPAAGNARSGDRKRCVLSTQGFGRVSSSTQPPARQVSGGRRDRRGGWQERRAWPDCRLRHELAGDRRATDPGCMSGRYLE